MLQSQLHLAHKCRRALSRPTHRQPPRARQMAPTPKSEPPWASESVQSLDATALAHGPANNGCGAQSPFAQNPSQLLDRLCIGQNVRGLANDAHRKALFTALSEFHIVALSETHALPSDEARWARDWHGQRTFWSSVSDGTHHRGVALLFSDDLVMTDVRVHSDSDDADTTRPFAGRFLAVEATLYHRHKMLFIVTYAPGSRERRRRQSDRCSPSGPPLAPWGSHTHWRGPSPTALCGPWAPARRAPAVPQGRSRSAPVSPI
jgi:hypothetical protein